MTWGDIMGLLHTLTCRRCFSRSLVASAAAAPLAAILGSRVALAEAKPKTPVPGNPRTTKSAVLDTAADALQAKRPIDAMSEFLNGFHFYADDMDRQVRPTTSART